MGSVRRRGGVVRVQLVDAEVVMLASLVAQVHALLADGLPDAAGSGEADPLETLTGLRGGEVVVPDDPVMRRLLPDAYRDDEAASGEYRRLMDADLRLAKTAALGRVLGDLAGGGRRKGDALRVDLDEPGAEQWLYALNDLRLTLGTTLDVTEDWEDELVGLDPDSARHGQLVMYDWVSRLQEALVHAVAD